MSIRMIYDLMKWYRRRQKGEVKEEKPPIDPKKAYITLGDYAYELSKIFKRSIITTPYLYLIDPELRPEEKEWLEHVVGKTGGGAPLAARLAVKLDVPEKRSFAWYFGPVLELILFLNGIEHEDEALRRPDLIREAFKFARAFALKRPYIYEGLVLPPDPSEITKIVPVGLYDSERFLKIEDIEMWEKWFEEFYRQHPELLEEARKAMEGVVREGANVRVVGPPRAVDIILSKLEVVREQGRWLGGVDLRLLRRLLYDVREGRAVVWGAFGLLREWGRGKVDAFFEGYVHIKGVPEGGLSDYGVVGDVEALRRGLVSGELSVEDVSSVLTALYTVYSIVEACLTEFLSGIEEHVTGEGKSLMVKPDDLEEQVIKPLRERLREVRVLVRGERKHLAGLNYLT